MKGKLTVAALAVIITGIALPMTAHADTISATPPSASPSPSQGIGEPAYGEWNYVPTFLPSTGAEPSALPADIGPSDGREDLAATGAPVWVPFVGVAIVLVFVGAAVTVLVGERRRAQ